MTYRRPDDALKPAGDEAVWARAWLALAGLLLIGTGCTGTIGSVTPTMERDFGTTCVAAGHPAGSPAYLACVRETQRKETPDQRARRIRDAM